MGFPPGGKGPGGKGFGGSPRPGEQFTGMVKSYNRKGFGFIMCQNLDADVYFSRECLAPQLQTSDLAGEYVQFECIRFHDGKLQARTLRPLGEPGITRGPDGFGGVTLAGRGKGCMGKGLLPASMLGGKDGGEEDRSRDWFCEGCGERNFVKRFECYKCKAVRPRQPDDGLPPTFAPPPPVRRTLSPHAGSRAMREAFKAKGAGKGPSRSPSRRRKRRSSSSGERAKKKRDQSSESSSSSSDKKKRRKRRKKGKGKSSDSSSSASEAARGGAGSSAAAAAQEEAPANPEVEKAKSEVLEKLLKLKEINPREARIREWRALLREWHPDKNPDKTEVATAVFQFLQKGKALIDG